MGHFQKDDSDSKFEELSFNSAGDSISDAEENRWDFGPGAVATSSCSKKGKYNMDLPRKGKCYIFNHRKFKASTKLNVRKGTGYDATALCDLFEELGFNEEDIRCFVDLEAKEIEDVLITAAKEDNERHACFVCCILTHGYSGMLYAYDKLYETETILAPFRADVCSKFAGKPKIFLIQACEGDKCDRKKQIQSQDLTDSGSSKRQSLKIPTHADFLIACCRIPGYYAWEAEERGSWFIQALCDTFRKDSNEKNLLQMLIKVNRKVADTFENYSSGTLKKQVPYITTTLTKNVMFSGSTEHSVQQSSQDKNIEEQGAAQTSSKKL